MSLMTVTRTPTTLRARRRKKQVGVGVRHPPVGVNSLQPDHGGCITYSLFPMYLQWIVVDNLS